MREREREGEGEGEGKGGEGEGGEGGEGEGEGESERERERKKPNMYDFLTHNQDIQEPNMYDFPTHNQDIPPKTYKIVLQMDCHKLHYVLQNRYLEAGEGEGEGGMSFWSLLDTGMVSKCRRLWQLCSGP